MTLNDFVAMYYETVLGGTVFFYLLIKSFVTQGII